MDEEILISMKSEADGFVYVFEGLNKILSDNFFEKESGKVAQEINLVNCAIVNGCFACELYLKLIIKSEKKEIINTHNLKRLFLVLNGKTQNRIIKHFTDKEYTEDLFSKKLNYMANGFEIARYGYENNEQYYLLAGFLLDLLEILKNMCNDITIETKK